MAPYFRRSFETLMKKSSIVFFASESWKSEIAKKTMKKTEISVHWSQSISKRAARLFASTVQWGAFYFSKAVEKKNIRVNPAFISFDNANAQKMLEEVNASWFSNLNSSTTLGLTFPFPTTFDHKLQTSEGKWRKQSASSFFQPKSWYWEDAEDSSCYWHISTTKLTLPHHYLFHPFCNDLNQQLPIARKLFTYSSVLCNCIKNEETPLQTLTLEGSEAVPYLSA